MSSNVYFYIVKSAGEHIDISDTIMKGVGNLNKSGYDTPWLDYLECGEKVVPIDQFIKDIDVWFKAINKEYYEEYKKSKNFKDFDIYEIADYNTLILNLKRLPKDTKILVDIG